MATQTITCATCQTTLSIRSDLAPNAKVKCPKCGQVVVVPTKKMVLQTQSEPTPSVEARPIRSRSFPTDTPRWSYVFPAGSILVGLLALALPFIIDQYVLGLILACLAMPVCIGGLVILFLKKWNGLPTHLAGLAICAAAILLAINVLLLKASIETNYDLRTQNEKTASQAKADRDDAKRKLADAEDALKKADDAPKKAEAFFKMGKEAQDKADATEKRTADLLAKAEEAEKKNDQDRKKIADDKTKAERAHDDLKETQRALDKTKREIEEKKQELVSLKMRNESEQKKAEAELVALKKQNEADKKRAEDDLAALKKEIDADKKIAEEKEKDAKAILKRVEEVLKGASLKLQDKNPQVRYKTAKQLAKLPVFPEAKEFVGEAICLAMLDAVPEVRNAAAEALEKIDPAVHPLMVTLVLGQNKYKAIQELGALGKKAKSVLPVFIYYHDTAALSEKS